MSIQPYEWNRNKKGVLKIDVPELALQMFIKVIGNEGYQGVYVFFYEKKKVGYTDIFETEEEARQALVTNLLTGFMKTQTRLMASLTMEIEDDKVR